jgi:tetratricopeptide (TPR) repeat protein
MVFVAGSAEGTRELGYAEPSPLGHAIPLPPGVVVDEPLPDEGPRFDRPIHAPGSIPFGEGLAALERQAYAEAVTAFQRVIEKFPKSPLAASSEAFLAEIHVMKDLTPQSRADAIGQYRHLVVTYPNNDNARRAYWRIGDLYAGMGLYPEAHGAYSRLLAEGMPGRDLERALLGSAVNKLLWGKGTEAADDFEALRRHTRDELLLRYASIGLADALALQRKYAEAKELYEAGFRAWPDEVKRHPRSFLSFARTYSELGLGTKARWLYEQFYNLNPTHYRSGAMLIRAGDTFLREQRPDRALLFYRQVLNQYTNTEASDQAYLRLAQLGGEMISQDRDHSLATQVKGLMDLSSGPVLDEAAQETIYRAVAIDRADTVLGSEALFLLGQHHERTGNLTEAVTVYRSLREREGTVADDPWPNAATQRLREILGPWVSAALQRQDDLTAVKLFRLAGPEPERVYPNVDLLVGVADAYQRLGLSGEAVKLYQVTLRTADNDRTLSATMLGLGRAYMDQADIAAARQVFQRYRLQFPLAAGRGEALTALITLAEKERDLKTVIRLSKLWLRDFADSPKRTSVTLSLAEALVQAGAFDEALRLYAETERRPSVTAATWLHHADVLAKAGRPADAAKRYQLALFAKPTPEEEAWARVRLASVLRQLNRRADAAAVLAPLRVRNADPLVSRYSSMLERDLDLGGG